MSTAKRSAANIDVTLSRRDLLGLGAATFATAATGSFAVADSTARRAPSRYAMCFAKLDRFIERYMREMRAPGMTLVLADRDGVQRVVTYGFGDLERRRAVQREQLFQIGSISKSFLALCLLQLRDEGKLDLHKPITDYLPWFRIESSYAPITTHHLLTHSSGLPGAGDVFLSHPDLKHRAAYTPGAHFYYNNMAFELLGHLAWTLDGQELPGLLRRRILGPLGMDATEPVITLDMRDRLVKSYSAFRDDRPGGIEMQLCEAPGIIQSSAAGSISSSPDDMGLYVQMLAKRGVGPNGRVVSEDGFGLFSKSHIRAEEFGPTANYGYGIAVDVLDGNPVVRHTGGMVSFASAILVDTNAEVGAFASINAMQQYRPTAVVEFATRLMRAASESKTVAGVEVAQTPIKATLDEYVGVYRDAAGHELRVALAVEGLVVERRNQSVSLLPGPEADRFHVPNSATEHFAMVFGRQDAHAPSSPVVDVAWGEEWYTNAAYGGPREFTVPVEFAGYAGHYRHDSPWIGSVRIVLRQGQLWMDGVTPLVAEQDWFRPVEAEPNPEWLQFKDVVNGRCMRLVLSGTDLRRVAAS